MKILRDERAQHVSLLDNVSVWQSPQITCSGTFSPDEKFLIFNAEGFHRGDWSHHIVYKSDSGEFLDEFEARRIAMTQNDLSLVTSHENSGLVSWDRRLDPLFEVEFPDLSDEQKEEIKKREITARKIAEAPERIEMIALDFAKHYQENFEPDGFKAQVATCSQRAAAAATSSPSSPPTSNEPTSPLGLKPSNNSSPIPALSLSSPISPGSV